MSKIFVTISILCAFVAMFFLWRGNLEVTFIVAVLGVVAWFLNLRFNFKKLAEEKEKTEAEDLQQDES